jgi:O-antigen/teichoic acid export membrane protein
MDINEEETINRGLKFIAKSSLIVFIGIFLSKLLVYGYRIIIARHYGPEVYGLLALSIMLIGWFRLVAGFGIKQGLVRYIPLFKGKKQEKKIPLLFKKSFSLLVVTSVLAGILLFFLSSFIALKIFHDSGLIIFLKIFSIVVPLAVLGEALLSTLRAYEKIGWFSFISYILGNLMKLLFLIIFIFLGINSNSVPISYLIGALTIFVVVYIVCRILFPEIFNLAKKIDKGEAKKTFKEMFSYSWPFLFYGIASFIFYSIDSFMIGIFKTAGDVGFYNAAAPIASLLIFPLTIFIQLFFPLVTKEFSKGRLEVVKQLSQQVSKWVFMIVLPIFVLFIVFPGDFITFLFGSEYLVAENALRFLSIGALFFALFGISQELLSMKGKSKLLLADMIFAGILNVILNFILVPLHGITGAGFATMISMIVLNMLFFIQAKKYLSIVPLRKRMFRIMLITIVSTASLLVIKSFFRATLLSLVLCGIFFIAVYTLLLLTTGCLDKNDLYIMKSVVRKIRSRSN